MHDIASLYHDLLDDLQINTGLLTSDLDVETARRVWLANSFFKKLKPSDTKLADRACLDKFLFFNDTCRRFVLSPVHPFHDHVIGEVKTSLNDVVWRGPELKLDLASISAGFGLGPGANLDCESYDFYTKLYNSSLSRTDDRLYRYYRCAIVDNPLVLRAELDRKAHRGDAIVAGSRLSFVPKTSEVSRSICTEPTLNMLFQKGIGAYLEGELKRLFHVDLSRQPILNRRLARVGSLDGSFGTIDLSNASDSISIALVKELVPDVLFRWLMLARSPVTVLPDGTTVKLEMISSMGNAFTFPLMTLIFASLVTACYRVLGIKPGLAVGNFGSDKQMVPLNWAVFGDDIIVEKSAYEFVIGCLKLFGFSVNESKSFSAGSFRESCGGDYFKGHDIRGVYLKELKHDTHVYSAFNRLARWSAKSGVLLLKVSRRLYSAVPEHRRWLIPYTDGDAEGFKVPYELFIRLRPKLDDALLRRRDTSAKMRKQLLDERARPHSETLGANTTGYFASVAIPRSFAVPAGDLQSAEYAKAEHGLTGFPSMGVSSDELVPAQSKLPGFRYNGAGLWLALLGGFVRNGRISLRESEDDVNNRTKVHRRYSSSWNWTPVAGCDGRDFVWELMVEEYLCVPCTELTAPAEAHPLPLNKVESV